MPMTFWALVVVLLSTIGCASRGPVVRAADSREYLSLAQLEESALAFVRDCNEHATLRMLEPRGKQLTLDCSGGQIQVQLAQCNGWEPGIELRMIALGNREGFQFYGWYPENDCSAVGLHAERTGERIGRRLISVITQMLGLEVGDHVWLQKEHYAYVRAS